MLYFVFQMQEKIEVFVWKQDEKTNKQQITQFQSLSTVPKRNWDEESELDSRVGQKLTAGYGIGKAYFEPPPCHRPF